MTAYINPEILIWGREHNSLTIEELATSMKRDPGELRMWESGGKTPSYTSLEELAYRHFYILLAASFFTLISHAQPSGVTPAAPFCRY